VLLMSRVQIVQPPRIATWLVGLFITEEQTGKQEQITDRFSEMALTCGSGPARRWYWKQSAKTIVRHIAREFRTAPWLIVGAAFGGALLFYLGTEYLGLIRVLTITILNHHMTPYTLLIISLLESLIVGCLVAGVAKRREMIATMSLSFISLVVTVTDFWVSVAIRAPVNPSFFFAHLDRPTGCFAADDCRRTHRP
jgi:hypothetical protein